MTQFTTALDNALRAPTATIFGALEIVLPGYALRLLDGSGFVDFGGHRFVGRDATFGVLSAITNLTDGSGDEVPSLNITLLPASDAAAASLASANMQGSKVSLWLGAVDPVSGIVIPDPYLVFFGELDVPVLKSSNGTRSLEYEVVSVMERLFADDEGIGLSQGFHQSIWPGETGFAAVTGVQSQVYWGVNPPPNVVATYSSAPGYNLGAYQ